jgi:hypothetical protein
MMRCRLPLARHLAKLLIVTLVLFSYEIIPI